MFGYQFSFVKKCIQLPAYFTLHKAEQWAEMKWMQEKDTTQEKDTIGKTEMGQYFSSSVVDIDLHVGETLSFFQSLGTVEVVSERFMM